MSAFTEIRVLSDLRGDGNKDICTPHEQSDVTEVGYMHIYVELTSSYQHCIK